MLASIVKCDKPKRLTGLDQKVSSGCELWTVAHREPSLPVYRADLNHPVDVVEHGNVASLPALATGQTYRKAGQRQQHWDDRTSQSQH
jgi:hypothetical protein